MAQEALIPDELLRFVDANVESIEHLEMLRILGEAEGRERRAAELAREAQIQLGSIAGSLAILEKRGLVKTHIRDEHLFCAYGPITPHLDALLRQLLQLYKERPVTLIKTVYARGNERLAVSR